MKWTINVKYRKGIDLRDHVDPGDVYVDNFSRSWTIEEVYNHVILGTRKTEKGFIIRECFNLPTLLTEGVLKV